MRRMIPQKLIDKLVARLEREEQTKEMLKNITVVANDEEVSGYIINLASDGDTYLTITCNAGIDDEDENVIDLENIPANFLSKLLTTGPQTYSATNSLGAAENVNVTNGSDYITLHFAAGAQREVFSTITLTTEIKEL